MSVKYNIPVLAVLDHFEFLNRTKENEVFVLLEYNISVPSTEIIFTAFNEEKDLIIKFIYTTYQTISFDYANNNSIYFAISEKRKVTQGQLTNQ